MHKTSSNEPKWAMVVRPVAAPAAAAAAVPSSALLQMPSEKSYAAHRSLWPPKGRGARRLKASSRSSTKGAQAAALWGGQRARTLPNVKKLRHLHEVRADMRTMSPCELCCPQYSACDRPANAVSLRLHLPPVMLPGRVVEQGGTGGSW